MSEVAKILETEFSEQFVQGMKDRMVVSYYKYGLVAEGAPKTDVVKSLRDRLTRYLNGEPAKDIAAGNTEWLMDVANFAMIEFMFPKHPNAHFKGTDADQSPGRRDLKTGAATDCANTDLGFGANRSELSRFRG